MLCTLLVAIDPWNGFILTHRPYDSAQCRSFVFGTSFMISVTLLVWTLGVMAAKTPDIPSSGYMTLSAVPRVPRVVKGLFVAALTLSCLEIMSSYSMPLNADFHLNTEAMSGAKPPAQIAQRIEEHMQRYEARIQRVSACSRETRGTPSDACAERPQWTAREAAWRRTAISAERLRLETHAIRRGTFLPEDDVSVPIWIFDLFEPEFTCAQAERIPAQVGDGSKWMCGLQHHRSPGHASHACRVVSFGSNFEDSFERAMYDASGCHAYIVDPTLGAGAGAFRRKIAAYRASLNDTVGVGEASKLGSATARTSPAGFPLVTPKVLLHDHYGRPAGGLRVSVLKMDIVRSAARRTEPRGMPRGPRGALKVCRWFARLCACVRLVGGVRVASPRVPLPNVCRRWPSHRSAQRRDAHLPVGAHRAPAVPHLQPGSHVRPRPLLQGAQRLDHGAAPLHGVCIRVARARHEDSLGAARPR